MKYIVLLGDGMADYPLKELGDKTPLAFAKTPNMDAIVARGTLGLLQSIPENLPSGSDVANLFILGCDPNCCYTGRGTIGSSKHGNKAGKRRCGFPLQLGSSKR